MAGSSSMKARADARIATHTDWTDRFLAKGWLFARTAPIPPVDAPLSSARKQADQIETGNIFDGRPTMQLSRSRLEELLALATLAGIVGAVAHYARVDAARRALSARIKRGLFRLWCALSIVWIAFIAAAATWTWPGQLDWTRVVLTSIGPPLASLVLSVALIRLGVWVWNGFRGGP